MRRPSRMRRLGGLLVASALSLAVVSPASASWSGTEFTLDPHANTLLIQSHVRYQAWTGTIALTLDNGVSKGVRILLFNKVGNSYTQITRVRTWGAQATGKQYFQGGDGSTSIYGPQYWVPAASILSDCLSGCDLTYGGLYDYQGNQNGA